MTDIQGRVYSDFTPPATTDGSYLGTQENVKATEKHYQMKFDEELVKINQRLKSSNTKVTIECTRGGLQLRATLPLKPGDTEKTGRTKKQYKISLGIPANFDGLKTAEEEAYELGKLMARQTFTWNDKYLGVRASKDKRITFRDFYPQIEKRYFETRKRTLKSENTLASRLSVYKTHFIGDEVINGDNIFKKIVAINLPGARQNAIIVGRLIAKFFQIKINFRDLKLKTEKNERNIPTDKEIINCFSFFRSRYENRQRLRQDFQNNWKTYQLIYGFLAVYGLRPREVLNRPDLNWFSSPENKHNTFKVHKSNKTGFREVFPFVPEWIELFDLKNLEAIEMLKHYSSSWSNHQELSHRVGVISLNFKRACVPFKPYDLRHACAIRAHLQGMPIKAASDNLGHSVDMHTKVYQQWFGLENRRKAFEQTFHDMNENENLKDEITKLRKRIAELEFENARLHLENKVF